jgi:hypothetical protein
MIEVVPRIGDADRTIPELERRPSMAQPPAL